MAAIVTTAACGLDLGGEMFVTGYDASGAHESGDRDASAPESMGFVATGDPNAAEDAGLPDPAVPQPSDAGYQAQDAMSHADHAAVLDASVSNDATTDAGTVCARLVQCCPRLLAPPLALACLAGAMQDGGDSACEALLSSLVDAGVCR